MACHDGAGIARNALSVSQRRSHYSCEQSHPLAAEANDLRYGHLRLRIGWTVMTHRNWQTSNTGSELRTPPRATALVSEVFSENIPGSPHPRANLMRSAPTRHCLSRLRSSNNAATLNLILLNCVRKVTVASVMKFSNNRTDILSLDSQLVVYKRRDGNLRGRLAVLEFQHTLVCAINQYCRAGQFRWRHNSNLRDFFTTNQQQRTDNSERNGTIIHG